MKRWAVFVAAILPLIFCFMSAVGESQPVTAPAPFFPLKQGTYWIYQGDVRWTPSGSQEVNSANLTWKMEIVEVFRRETITAARLKGHPEDLVWYEGEGAQPGDYVIVQVGPRYYLVEGERAQEVWGRVKDETDVLVDLVHDDELFLEEPLALHETFGPADQIARTDFSYFWYVEQAEPTDLSGIKGFSQIVGASSQPLAMRYRLVYRTRPDHTFVDVVPGVGITRFIYGHHGTVAETDLKLVEFHQE